ncbi:MAG: DUF4276 family protein [Candidatus Poribacteria bacterium]|nr:DUF4276 family protein [Candidatus Poribacteria bacterium]MDE0504225.1 DUF4276 family protein [Candidatus Poribacteria bacterium]
MARLLVHVEGQTEEYFVNRILETHLRTHGFSNVSARLMGKPRQRSQRGGVRAWITVRKDITNHLKQDRGCIATTMVDYYGMPQTGSRAWPGRAEASNFAFPKNACTVENALALNVCEQMGTNFNPIRFVPHVMMHEFEAMLFSDCGKFAEGIGQPELAPKFQAIRDKFATPEEIDDSPETAPSKRIESLVPGYQKPSLGILAALDIGLAAIRSACPRFCSWLEKLEGIPANPDT